MLIHLRSNQKIDDIVKLLKGESSHWINAENLIRPKFSWQRGYGAFSISSSHVEAIREYIQNQEEHHRKKTYREEMISILRKYGFESDEIEATEK
ncbi:MAG: transposase [Ignavibacteriae bacterium]|nr:transposase [Ignavibacteriota bacterium]